MGSDDCGSGGSGARRGASCSEDEGEEEGMGCREGELGRSVRQVGSGEQGGQLDSKLDDGRCRVTNGRDHGSSGSWAGGNEGYYVLGSDNGMVGGRIENIQTHGMVGMDDR